MATDRNRPESSLQEITELLVQSYHECGLLHHLGQQPLPNRESVAHILKDLSEILFPGFGKHQHLHPGNIGYYVGNLIDSVAQQLQVQILRALRHEHCQEEGNMVSEAEAEQKALELLRRVPLIRATLEKDVEAAFRGDPAAKSCHEIVFSYPGLEAISIFRIAHELHRLGVPFIPRMMTELAHAKTGIDIHPGATIGPGFFIDHGTGVVIGETTHIGENVKLYQGVTLGALSFDRDENGDLVHGAYKRHPTLQDDVIVYANATILGGQTIIGQGSVIGSNVWLTKSVEPHSIVVLESPKFRVKSAKTRHADEALIYHI